MFEINGIVYANELVPMIKIVEAKITDIGMMLITFSTGEKRVFDASALNGPVFEPLKDNNIFQDFKISHGVLTWCDEEIDCAPEYIYEHSFAYEQLMY